MRQANTTTQWNACLLSVASGHGYKFTGKERDAESGPVHFIARYDFRVWVASWAPDEIGRASIPKKTKLK